MGQVRKSLVLSFDDGPMPESALDSIIGTLKSRGVRAEFYVLGEEVSKAPNAAKKIVDAGHSIQNHSWSHQRLDTPSLQVVKEELARTQEAIKRATGVTPTTVRPPYGNGGWPKRLDPELATAAKSLSLTVKNWDIDTRDWAVPVGISQEKRQTVIAQIMSHTKGTLNVLMHVLPATARDLPQLLTELLKSGCMFTTPT